MHTKKYENIPEWEKMGIQYQDVINALGEMNFGIHIVDLQTGAFQPVKVAANAMEVIYSGDMFWDAMTERMLESGLYSQNSEEFFEKFSLKALRQAWTEGKEKIEVTSQRRFPEGFRYVSATAHFYKNPEQGGYVVIAFRDIDDRVRKDIKRSQQDRRMAAIIESRFQMMTTVHLETGAGERIWLDKGGEPKKVLEGDYAYFIKKALEQSIFEEDKELFINTLDLNVLREKAHQVENFMEENCRYRVKSPSLCWVEAHVFYLRQKGGVVVNILGRDITQEKLREEEQERSKQERASIINTLSGLYFAVYYIDMKNQTFRMITQRQEVGEVLGASVDYTVGISTYARNFIHSEDQQEYLEIMDYKNVMKSLDREHPTISMEYRSMPKDDDEKQSVQWIRATVVMAEEENGKPKTALYVAQDVTDVKQKETRERQILKEAYDAAKQASMAKSDFLSKMSHDIRTPLNAIIGMTAIAGTYINEPDRMTDCLNKINLSGKHLLALINDVLDMSKIESGKMNLTEEEFTIPELVENLLAMVRPSIEEKQHQLVVDIEEVRQKTVIGDMVRLQQVFVNLLSNSIKYTPAGGKIRLEIKEKKSGIEGYGCYKFMVEDNGIGMSEEFQRKLYEPFCREEDSRISKIEGTGLGMTIAQNIISMMNGTISVESRPDQGSKFEVTLYLKQQKESAPEKEIMAKTHPESDEKSNILNLQGRRILLVEDNELNREIAVEIVGMTGATVETACDGQEAVNRFVEHEAGYYDLIFMDIQMPVLNGHEAAKAIRKSGKSDAAAIPIVAMTANAFSEDIIASQQAGMNQHISKPLYVEELMNCMKYWILDEKADSVLENKMIE